MLVASARRGKLTALVALARRGKLTALVALARRDTNRVAVAGISPGLSVSETPGLGVAGCIIHIYRVAVAAKQPMGVRQTTDGGCGETTDGGCGETTNGGCGETTNGVAAKQPTGLWRNNQRGRGKRPTDVRRNDQRGRNTGGVLSMRMYCRNRYAVISIITPGIPHPRGFAGAQPRAISRNRSAVE